MEHLEGIEEARWMMEEAKKELDLEQVGIKLDPEHEQNQNDCHQEEAEPHPDYFHLDTDGIETTDNSKVGSDLFKKIIIPDRIY